MRLFAMPKSIKKYIQQTTNALEIVLQQYEALIQEQVMLGNLSATAATAKLNALEAQLWAKAPVLQANSRPLMVNEVVKQKVLNELEQLIWHPQYAVNENDVLDELVLSLSNHIHCGAAQLQTKVNEALEEAVALFQKTGAITLSQERKVKIEVVNQVSNERFKVILPLMLAGGQSMHYNYHLVDRILTETKCHSTIFQRIPQGFLRIATNVTTTENKRAINTFIPNDSHVVHTILKGNVYKGSAFVVNNWYATAYHPIWIDGRIEGMVYVGLREYLPHLNQRISNVKLLQLLENLVDVYFADSHGSSAIEQLMAFFTHAQQGAIHNPFIELGLKELTVLLKQIKEKRDVKAANQSPPFAHPLSIVTDYIQVHLPENMTIESLAQVAHISKISLYRYFKETYALSPIDFINHERLTRALKLMDSTKKNIQVIGQEVGFESTSYFIKRFQQRFGMTPKQYSKQISLKMLHQE
jgi:methyl-accepting chemotaxis protein